MAVPLDPVVAHHSFFDRSQSLNGFLGADISYIGLQLHAHEVQLLKGMTQQHVFAFGVGARAPKGWRVPRPSDLAIAVVEFKTHIASAADEISGRTVHHHKGKLCSLLAV